MQKKRDGFSVLIEVKTERSISKQIPLLCFSFLFLFLFLLPVGKKNHVSGSKRMLGRGDPTVYWNSLTLEVQAINSLTLEVQAINSLALEVQAINSLTLEVQAITSLTMEVQAINSLTLEVQAVSHQWPSAGLPQEVTVRPYIPSSTNVYDKNNNNTVHSSCAHHRPERLHGTH